MSNGVMDYSEVAVSQEGKNTFSGVGQEKRLYSMELDRRQRKIIRIATP